jgi:hypothetical protein
MSLAVCAYLTCFSIAGVFFLVSTLVSDVIARTTIGSEGFGYAVSQHAYYAATQPIGTGMLLAPFFLVAWMASSIARRTSQLRGTVFLCIACSVLALMYFFAYQDSQHYMAQRMWTAATLAIGFLAFKSVPVLIVALITFLIVRRGPRVEP